MPGRPMASHTSKDVLCIPPAEVKAMVASIGDIKDDEPGHRRCRGLIGKYVHIPARQFGTSWSRAHPGEVYECLIIAFVPNAKPGKDKWMCFDPVNCQRFLDGENDGEEKDYMDIVLTEVFPLRKAAVQKFLVGPFPSLGRGKKKPSATLATPEREADSGSSSSVLEDSDDDDEEDSDDDDDFDDGEDSVATSDEEDVGDYQEIDNSVVYDDDSENLTEFMDAVDWEKLKWDGDAKNPGRKSPEAYPHEKGRPSSAAQKKFKENPTESGAFRMMFDESMDSLCKSQTDLRHSQDMSKKVALGIDERNDDDDKDSASDDEKDDDTKDENPAKTTRPYKSLMHNPCLWLAFLAALVYLGYDRVNSVPDAWQSRATAEKLGITWAQGTAAQGRGYTSSGSLEIHSCTCTYM